MYLYHPDIPRPPIIQERPCVPQLRPKPWAPKRGGVSLRIDIEAGFYMRWYNDPEYRRTFYRATYHYPNEVMLALEADLKRKSGDINPNWN